MNFFSYFSTDINKFEKDEDEEIEIDINSTAS